MCSLISSGTDSCWGWECSSFMWTMISSKTDISWCCGCPCSMWTLTPVGHIVVDAVAAHFICGHWLTLRLISIDAVVALAIWGHWFPVRLIPVDLWWPSLQVDTDFLETISHWCYAFPIYKWTQMSIEIDSRFTVAALVVCRHWSPVRLIAFDLCLPLIYLDTDFQWDRAVDPWLSYYMLMLISNETESRWRWDCPCYIEHWIPVRLRVI